MPGTGLQLPQKTLRFARQHGRRIRATTSPLGEGATVDYPIKPPLEQEPDTATFEYPDADQFSWTKQWYPIAAVQDLDPTRPHAEMLLGEKLVVWRDAESQWRCFVDECPHRLVPLSEGRIDESGSLMCGYHGWSFSGDGKPVKIPQLHSINKGREATICNNARACATSRPTQVRQGLLYIWGESGPSAEAESARTEAPVSSFREEHENSGKMWNITDQFVRDLPGSFEVWTENMQDQSHVPFAHHGVAGKRGGEKEGFFKMHRVESGFPKDTSEKGSAFVTHFDWAARGEAVNSSIQYFKPPCLTGFLGATSKLVSLYLHTVPLSAHATRLIINNVAIVPLPKRAQFLMGIKFVADYMRAKNHMMLNAVTCGDTIFMSGQHRALGRTATQKGDPTYFLPSEADKGVATWLQWLKAANGGPVYKEPAYTGDSFWDDSGKLKRRQLLDSYTQHTQKCSACSKLLTQVRALKTVALATLGLFFLTAAALLGRGCSPVSRHMAVIAGAAGLVAAGMRKLGDVERRLTFRDWVQADLAPDFKF